MKLSEAIRLGSMVRPQAFGGLRVRRFSWRSLRFEETTCAIGAAIEAGNVPTIEKVSTGGGEAFRGDPTKAGEKYRELQTPDEWNEVLWSSATCPQCHRTESAQRIIPHLNDDHKWTREQIAAWVELIEHARETSQQPKWEWVIAR